MNVEEDLFPPPKKCKENINFNELLLNTVDIEFCIDSSNLKLDNIEVLNKFLNDEKDIFGEITVPVKNIEHSINTEKHEPISTPPYRISPTMKVKLKTELDSMKDRGIIEEMESPWAFPVVIMPKKDGSIRVCVDYRRLNSITITDTYPLPRIDDLLHAAKTTPFMTTMDLTSGYWQIKVASKDIVKTAFTTPFGIFVFNRMPFGLKNASATFQRLIDKFRSKLPDILILAYLDDIIIYSRDFHSHIYE